MNKIKWKCVSATCSEVSTIEEIIYFCPLTQRKVLNNSKPIDNKRDGGGNDFYSKINNVLKSKELVIDNHNFLLYINLPNRSKKSKIKHLYIQDGIIKLSKFDKKSPFSYKYNSIYCWIDSKDDRLLKIPGVVSFYKQKIFEYVENNKNVNFIRNNYQYLISHLL